VGHHEKLPRKLFEAECPNTSVPKISLPLGTFLALDIVGYFWEGFRPRGFRAPGQGRIGPHPELYILAPQCAFSGRMSRMLGYLEGG